MNARTVQALGVEKSLVAMYVGRALRKGGAKGAAPKCLGVEGKDGKTPWKLRNYLEDMSDFSMFLWFMIFISAHVIEGTVYKSVIFTWRKGHAAPRNLQSCDVDDDKMYGSHLSSGWDGQPLMMFDDWFEDYTTLILLSYYYVSQLR